MQKRYNAGVDHDGRVTGIADPGRLGAAIRELRRSAGFTQQHLAERAGVSRLCVSDLERAARHTRTANLLRVVAALGYEIDLHPAPPASEDLTAYVASFTDT